MYPYRKHLILKAIQKQIVNLTYFCDDPIRNQRYERLYLKIHQLMERTNTLYNELPFAKVNIHL